MSYIMPAPRIPLDPPGVVPIPTDRVSCTGCCMYVGGDYWPECAAKSPACCIGDRLVHYIPLRTAIARGIIRQSWSDA